MNLISKDWPLVHKKNLCVINEKANIAIVTYWSNIEYIRARISDFSNINTLGNAYSKILCLNPILVNLSANRYIRYLILCGDDKENAEHTIISFFNGDLINLMDEEYKEHLNNVKKQINIIKCTLEDLDKTIKSLPKLPPYDIDVVDIQAILKPKSSVIWNSHDSGYLLRSDDLLELFFKINQKIMTRGKNSRIRDNEIREINNMVTVYNGPILNELDDCFLISTSRIKDYYEEFKSRKIPEDQSYTYSGRIFIEKIINELRQDEFTKRGYSPIFNPDDYNLNNNPCAVGVHYLIISGKLHCTVFFRSNDMFRAWPLNMLGFRYQQMLIATELGYDLGPITIVSSSAHIYSENWVNANDLIDRIKYIKNKFFDPEGYFICSKEEDNTILINYYSIDGKIQWMWQKPNHEYEELINEVTTYLTDTQHAGYIAKEITKLAHNIYSENSANKMLKEIPSCVNSACGINDVCGIDSKYDINTNGNVQKLSLNFSKQKA